MRDIRWPDMPYPGLRPFDVSAERDESVIFFGRKKQIYELIDRLATSHLIAVLGPSGCGKSSLIRAGVIPNLEKGYLDRAGARWTAVVMEPGGRPVRALAIEMHKALAASAPDGKVPDRFAGEELEQQLNRRPDALVELFEDQATTAVCGPDRNILILVDQFEELFRQDMTSEPDALHFINLMLNVYHNPPERLYIVLTMRTDFIKQSACYPGLPTVLSRTMSLIDKIDNIGLRDAITEPVKLKPYHGEISEDLTRWILRQMTTDDRPYDPDLLPLMQHALLLGWQNARKKAGSEADEKAVLSLEDYAQYTDLADCLSQHADAIFNALTPEQQRIAQVMFRLLCDVTADGTRIRRVTSPEEIAAVAECQDAEAVRTVIAAFTAEGAGFIRWKAEGKMLDVSHESFIRKWEKFDHWAEREDRKAKKYKKLMRRARDREKEGLLDRVALDRYSNWKNEPRPTAAWAERYEKETDKDPVASFTEVEKYISDSEVEIKNQAERERSKRQIIYGLSSAFIFVGLIALLIWWFTKPDRMYTLAIDFLNKNQPTKAIDVLDKELSLIHQFAFYNAYKMFTKNSSLDIRLAQIHLTKAGAHLSLADLKESINSENEKNILESYYQIIDRQPDNTKAHYLLVDLIRFHLMMSKAEDAKARADEIFKIIEKSDIKSADIYIRIGGDYQSTGNYRMAKRAYMKGFDKYSNNSNLLIALGNIDLYLADETPYDGNLLTEAERFFIQAKALDAQDTSVLDGLSTIYLRQNKRNEAINTLELLAEIDPNNRQVCTRLITEYFNQISEFISDGSKKRALEYLYRVNRRSACLSDLDYINIGQFYSSLGETDHAILAFGTSILKQKQMGRDNPEPYFLLANTYAKKERYAEAIENYDSVLKIIPHDFRAIRGMAFCRKMIGDTEMAAELYRQAERFEPWAPLTAIVLEKDGMTVK